MIVALISDVFDDGAEGIERLRRHLADARARGAELALLPELPLNAWSPATEVARDEDAEPPQGPRHRALADAARHAAVAVVGGAIVRDPATGRRFNTALVFDADGALISSYRKVHLPEEAGFWETRHYEPGDALPQIFEVPRQPAGTALRFGLQICSDINRPQGSQLLGAMGADAILNPRATEAATFLRWRTVFIANAMTSGAYVLSVNRPRSEAGVPLGGPAFAVAPTGEVLVETTDTVALVALDGATVTAARRSYPGYLATRSDLYSEGWKRVERTTFPHEHHRRERGAGRHES